MGYRRPAAADCVCRIVIVALQLVASQFAEHDVTVRVSFIAPWCTMHGCSAETFAHRLKEPNL